MRVRARHISILRLLAAPGATVAIGLTVMAKMRQAGLLQVTPARRYEITRHGRARLIVGPDRKQAIANKAFRAEQSEK